MSFNLRYNRRYSWKKTTSTFHHFFSAKLRRVTEADDSEREEISELEWEEAEKEWKRFHSNSKLFNKVLKDRDFKVDNDFIIFSSQDIYIDFIGYCFICLTKVLEDKDKDPFNIEYNFINGTNLVTVAGRRWESDFKSQDFDAEKGKFFLKDLLKDICIVELGFSDLPNKNLPYSLNTLIDQQRRYRQRKGYLNLLWVYFKGSESEFKRKYKVSYDLMKDYGYNFIDMNSELKGYKEGNRKLEGYGSSSLGLNHDEVY